MGWNYVATLSPTAEWGIVDSPAGSVDEGALWVMFNNAMFGISQFAYFSHALPQTGTSFSVKPTDLRKQANGSPCLMNVHGQLVTLWAEFPNGLYWSVLDPNKSPSLSPAEIPGGDAPAGPLAAFVPATNSLFVVWSGPSSDGGPDRSFFYSNVTGLGTDAPDAANAQRFATGPGPYSSWRAPAVAATREGGIAMVWLVWDTHELLFASAPDSEEPMLSEAILVASQAYDGPSLAVHVTGPKATLVAVYTSLSPRRVRYRVSEDGKSWTAPGQDGTVPLGDLLAHAGPDGGAVELTNPVAAWVTAPGSSDTLYLLVADRPINSRLATGPLYLVRYTGDNP